MATVITKGSVVEVIFQGAWHVATLVDQTESGYLVSYHDFVEGDNNDKVLSEFVDPCSVRPIPPRNIRRNQDKIVKEAHAVIVEDDGVGVVEFEVGDVVDACHRNGWRPGVVKGVVSEEGFRRYVVKFENPFVDFVFEKGKMRFHVDWVGSRWMVPPKKAASEQSEALVTDDAQLKSLSSNSSVDGSLTYSRKRFQSSTGVKGNPKFIESVLEANGSHQHSSSAERETIVTNKQTREASHRRRKRARPQKFAVNKPIDGHEVSTEINEQPLSSLKRSSCSSSKNEATVTSGPETNTDYQKDWPFIKRSPLWAMTESYPSQKPHFLPLKKMRKDYREGLAIGHLTTYANLVKMVSDKGLQPKDSVDTINAHLETLGVLQTHGFDVDLIRGRLKELLSLKSKAGEHENARKEVEKELEVCYHEKSLLKEERGELEVQMRVLKELMDNNAAMEKVKEEEIVRLKSKLDLVSGDWEDAFEKLVGSPL
ncbi:DUF724 domain-containing protein 2-like [Bidens hawaiensis]|uniref:DUF724 domain-containing protein 2-like n=1 Tax=Bidens hawaiensis TaxID=980011 RepID=UPI00404ADB63